MARDERPEEWRKLGDALDEFCKEFSEPFIPLVEAFIAKANNILGLEEHDGD